jgi:hypothetical protein
VREARRRRNEAIEKVAHTGAPGRRRGAGADAREAARCNLAGARGANAATVPLVADALDGGLGALDGGVRDGAARPE